MFSCVLKLPANAGLTDNQRTQARKGLLPLSRLAYAYPIMSTETHRDVSPPAPASLSARHRRPTSRLSFVGVLGELLIVAGALLALFVVWQLFYTDVQSGRVQRAEVEETEWLEPSVVDGVVAAEVPDDGFIPEHMKMRGVDPPAMEYPEFTEKFAAMMVPRWGEDYVQMVYEGTTRPDVLDPLGVGHYEAKQFNTVLPGETGNFALSAHRTTYNKPFADVADLHEGDSLVFQTDQAWFVYKVESWKIVLPHQTEVVAPMPDQPGVAPDDRYITLTTCHPKFSAAERWVVHGRLDYWAPVGHGIPEELVELQA